MDQMAAAIREGVVFGFDHEHGVGYTWEFRHKRGQGFETLKGCLKDVEQTWPADFGGYMATSPGAY